MLRTAVQIGLFTVSAGRDAEGPPRFQNNRLSAVLREDHPNCLKHLVRGRTRLRCMHVKLTLSTDYRMTGEGARI